MTSHAATVGVDGRDGLETAATGKREAPMIMLSIAMLALRAVPGGTDQAAIDAIIREGKDHSQVMPRLTELCTKIGARLTGSPRLTDAQMWAMDRFRKMGLKNVHLDEWGEVARGLRAEGRTTSAKLGHPRRGRGEHGLHHALLDQRHPRPREGRGRSFAPTALRDDRVGRRRPSRASGSCLPPLDPAAGGGRPGGGRRRPDGAPPAGAPPAGTPPASRPAQRGPSGRRATHRSQRSVRASPRPIFVAALDKLPIAGIVRGSRNELVVTSGTLAQGKTLRRATPASPPDHSCASRISTRSSMN